DTVGPGQPASRAVGPGAEPPLEPGRVGLAPGTGDDQLTVEHDLYRAQRQPESPQFGQRHTEVTPVRAVPDTHPSALDVGQGPPAAPGDLEPERRQLTLIRHGAFDRQHRL